MKDEAIAVMREIGIDISAQRPKHLAKVLGPDVALAIGLCAEEACPVVPGARSLHWPFPDPRPGHLQQFREVRDGLRSRIDGLKAELEAGQRGEDG